MILSFVAERTTKGTRLSAVRKLSGGDHGEIPLTNTGRLAVNFLGNRSTTQINPSILPRSANMDLNWDLWKTFTRSRGCCRRKRWSWTGRSRERLHQVSQIEGRALGCRGLVSFEGFWLGGRQGLLCEINAALDDIDFHTL